MPSCLVHPSLYHIKSLPSFPSLGRSQFFQEALLSLLSSSSHSPIFTLGSHCRFFCLLFYVLVFAFPPGILGWSLGQRLRWDSWAFPPAECRTWCPGAGLSVPSEVLPPPAHRGHAVQGADRLSVRRLRGLLNFQIPWTENSFWLKPCGQCPNNTTNIFQLELRKGASGSHARWLRGFSPHFFLSYTCLVSFQWKQDWWCQRNGVVPADQTDLMVGLVCQVGIICEDFLWPAMAFQRQESKPCCLVEASCCCLGGGGLLSYFGDYDLEWRVQS